MRTFRIKFRAILDIIKSEKFALFTLTKDNELDWWTEFNLTREDYIDKI